MNSMQTEKIERFMTRIDFNSAVKLENNGQAVSIIWPDMLKAPGLDTGQWMIAADNTWRENGGVAREWLLQRDKEQIAIVIFVSSEELEPAQRFFLTRTTENMMLETPFVKGPTGLGSLAVSMPLGAPPNLIWFFRSVCFDVRGINTQVDITTIARWLQSFADKGVVSSEIATLRAPGKLSVSSHQADIGLPINIQLKINTPVDDARYMIDLEFDRHVLEVVSQEKLSAQIRGRAEGHTVLDFFLIDKATLLVEQKHIKLEFTSATLQ